MICHRNFHHKFLTLCVDTLCMAPMAYILTHPLKLAQWGQPPQKFRDKLLDLLPEKVPKSPFSAFLNIRCQIIGNSRQIEYKKGQNP